MNAYALSSIEMEIYGCESNRSVPSKCHLHGLSSNDRKEILHHVTYALYENEGLIRVKNEIDVCSSQNWHSKVYDLSIDTIS